MGPSLPLRPSLWLLSLSLALLYPHWTFFHPSNKITRGPFSGHWHLLFLLSGMVFQRICE